MLSLEEQQLCKLTDSQGYTENHTLWGENITHEVTGDSTRPLCTSNWIHYYEHPLIAAFMNPAHEAFAEPLLWSVVCTSRKLNCSQTKSGCVKLTTLHQLKLPVITTEQRIEIGIRCAMTVYEDTSWLNWAQKWINKEDRTACTASADYAAAAATSADYAAAVAATYADYAAAAANAANSATSADYAAAAAATSADYAAAAATYADYAAAAADVDLPLLQIIKEILKLT